MLVPIYRQAVISGFSALFGLAGESVEGCNILGERNGQALWGGVVMAFFVSR